MIDAAARGAPASGPQPSIPATVINEAINWSVRLQFSEADADARKRFARWLEADPLHARAWERVQSLRDDFTRVPAKLALETLESAQATRRSSRSSVTRRRQMLKALAWAGVTVIAASAARELAPWKPWLADVSTGTGERRTVRLSDGTTIVLNTNTALNTSLDAARRTLTLCRGEILVSTGHDTLFASGARPRPFWVETPFGTLRALGTRFVVRIDEDHVGVSVQQGAVELHPGGGEAQGIVEAGKSWRMTRDASASVLEQPFAADGWVDGVIAGDDMRLTDVLAELARYRTGWIDCDPRVANLRVSGSFRTVDTDRALRFLSQAHPLRVTYLTRFWVKVGPAEDR